MTTRELWESNGFAEMGLSGTMLAALRRARYQTPSPVQASLIPPALEGRDCLGNAPTGTGKTAAFLVPIIEKMNDKERKPSALILAPTRELVGQIGREFERLAHGRPCRAVGIVGGESINQQQRLLAAGAQVLIATPGRLIDLIGRRAVRLDSVRHVILDEADQMLDIGFRGEVEQILDGVPRPRQTLLLSATMPPEVRSLANKYLVDPIDVRLIPEEDATIPSIRQHYLMVLPDQKVELLRRLLQREQPQRAIIFCRTKRGADKLGTLVRSMGFSAEAMHGNLTQNQRYRVLSAFRTGRLPILAATDVVGRGIDVRGVSHVINFDLPEDPSYYVHRVGRTGRMGADGIAFSLVMPDQAKMLDQIERAIGRSLETDQIEGVYAPPRQSPRSRRAADPRFAKKPSGGHGRPFKARAHAHSHGNGHSNGDHNHNHAQSHNQGAKPRGPIPQSGPRRRSFANPASIPLQRNGAGA